jgi:hypothetical protein
MQERNRRCCSYDNGSVYSAEVLKIKPADLQSYFLAGISQVLLSVRARVRVRVRVPTCA